MEKLYRYERLHVSSDLKATIILHTFPVLRATPKGVVIDAGGYEKWVPTDTKKRYAYPSEAEALTNFIKRTERCVKILTAQLDAAKEYLYAFKTNKLIKQPAYQTLNS